MSLFDGETLDGWIQIENSATSLSGGGITDAAAFAGKLAHGTDAISQFLRQGMEDSLKSDLAAYSPSAANAKAVISALTKYLNQVIAGPPFYEQAHAGGLALRAETKLLLEQNPRGWQLARLNKLVLEDAYPGELAKSSTTGWIVKDGAMASTGSGRGVIYTAKDYSRFRLTFTMRHVSGNPDHQACVLIFCPGADRRQGQAGIGAAGRAGLPEGVVRPLRQHERRPECWLRKTPGAGRCGRIRHRNAQHGSAAPWVECGRQASPHQLRDADLTRRARRHTANSSPPPGPATIFSSSHIRRDCMRATILRRVVRFVESAPIVVDRWVSSPIRAVQRRWRSSSGSSVPAGAAAASGSAAGAGPSDSAARGAGRPASCSTMFRRSAFTAAAMRGPFSSVRAMASPSTCRALSRMAGAMAR